MGRGAVPEPGGNDKGRHNKVGEFGMPDFGQENNARLEVAVYDTAFARGNILSGAEDGRLYLLSPAR